jgi:hypothetical protein
LLALACAAQLKAPPPSATQPAACRKIGGPFLFQPSPDKDSSMPAMTPRQIKIAIAFGALALVAFAVFALDSVYYGAGRIVERIGTLAILLFIAATFGKHYLR